MLIIGWVFVFLVAFYCLFSSVAVSVVSRGLNGKESAGAPVLLAIATVLFLLTYEFAPFSLSFKAL